MPKKKKKTRFKNKVKKKTKVKKKAELKGAVWDGVRNYQARNNLKKMKIGDLCFFYHSNIGKEIVGIVKPFFLTQSFVVIMQR